MPVNPTILNAPYSNELAAAQGWRDVIDVLDQKYRVTADQRVREESALYVSLKFTNGIPAFDGAWMDPSTHRVEFDQAAVSAIVKDTLCATLDEHPMHYAMFRHRAEDGWAAARLVDDHEAAWDRWRYLRNVAKLDRGQWFVNEMNPTPFHGTHPFVIYPVKDPATGELLVLQLHVGWETEHVSMMTSGLSDLATPRESDGWRNSGGQVELLLHCPLKPLKDAIESSTLLAATPEVAAITQVAEAFAAAYLGEGKPQPDLSEGITLQIGEAAGAATALAPGTPVTLTADHGEIELRHGLRFTPATVSIEGLISRRLDPARAAVKRVASAFNISVYEGSDNRGLFARLRDEIAEHGHVKSAGLQKRMRNYAAMEFHHGRVLPDDLATHVRTISFSTEPRFLAMRLHEAGDLHPKRHNDTPTDDPDLWGLAAYGNLTSVTLRYSRDYSLDWLEAVPKLEELIATGTTIDDFSPLSFTPHLRTLNLTQTGLTDLETLLSLASLETLHLTGLEIADISQLEKFTRLRELSLWDTPVTDIGPLANLTKLEWLSLAGVELTDYSALGALTNLTWLSLAGTTLADLCLLPVMGQLETLMLFDTNVEDLSPLEHFPRLATVKTTR